MTVNVVALVAVPPGVVTEIGTDPGFRPLLGTVAVICVPSAFTAKLALFPSNITAVVPVRLVPLIVTTVPPDPDDGVKLVIVGRATTVKLPVLVPMPDGVVTTIGPLVAPTGTTAVILLPLLLTVNCALAPPSVTVVAPLRFRPLIVTDAPNPPLPGEKLVIVGNGLTTTV